MENCLNCGAFFDAITTSQIFCLPCFRELHNDGHPAAPDLTAHEFDEVESHE